jgi:hypothetical protein
MAAWMACRAGRRIFHSASRSAAIVVLTVLSGQGLDAQTLTGPNAQPKSLPQPVAAKSPSVARIKTCSTFGAGFVQIPGSDTCVKIGGFVTMEGTAR